MTQKKTILFVDDEQNIIDGLRRMLRPLRHEWRVALANSGPEALEILEKADFDVIVSDMRMPGMDGAQLLTLVKERHPDIVRIILSGFTEIGQAMRAIGVAHQFLSKPCSPEILKAIIQRAVDLRERLNADPVRRAIGDIDGLPPLPETFRRLREALITEDVDLDHVASIVEEDASLTSKLLQLVNSSLFGLARPVKNMHEATNFLGITLLRDLTLTTETFRTFEKFTFPKGFSLSRHMAHSTLAAQIAREIAGGRGPGDEAFLAGMLHDLGTLVMATKMPEAFEEIAQVCATTGEPRFLVERRILGTNHAEIGAYLLGLWGLPDSIVEATAFHHEPALLPHTDLSLLEIVHVATSLADEFDTSEELAVPEAPLAILDLAHLKTVGAYDQLESWCSIARSITAEAA